MNPDRCVPCGAHSGGEDVTFGPALRRRDHRLLSPGVDQAPRRGQQRLLSLVEQRLFRLAPGTLR